MCLYSWWCGLSGITSSCYRDLDQMISKKSFIIYDIMNSFFPQSLFFQMSYRRWEATTEIVKIPESLKKESELLIFKKLTKK